MTTDETAVPEGAVETRAEKQTELLRRIGAVDGVSRLVPGFRELLTSPERALHALRGRSAATGVDVVVRSTGVRVYVDCCTDGSRPVAEVVDEVHEVVGASFDTVPDVQVRVLSID